ncbi:MAG: PilZ domain-containing protein [Afipia sp.]|nr:PilZ domain-containing protein [Afipia sp.]
MKRPTDLPTSLAATDKRRVGRQRVLKPGTIVFKGSGSISCVVRNISDSGAALEVISPIGIPETFELHIQGEPLRRHAHVVWRKEKRIGITFVETASYIR